MLVASVDSIRSVTLQLNCSGTRVKYFPVICKGENDSILVEAIYIFFFFFGGGYINIPSNKCLAEKLTKISTQ